MKSKVSRSISMKLSAISREKNVPYINILTEFLLERLLARLVVSQKLASRLIFKGGYVGRRAYGSPRYTTDLDVLLKGTQIESLQTDIIHAVESDIHDGAWFLFEKTVDLETQGEYPGVRFVFRTGLGEPLEDTRIAQIVNLDLGVGDFVEAVSAYLSPILKGEEISWQVYSKEVIVAEKLHACISKREWNSRSKDIFDLMFYLPQCDKDHLKEVVRRTFEKRATETPQDIVSEFKTISTELLKRGWISAVSGMSDTESFDEVFAKVVKLLEQKFS